MKNEQNDSWIAAVQKFRLPRYAEITNVGLYLEQVCRFVNTYLLQLGCPELTLAMVSNYVKQKIIPGPVRKTYGADSIAYLLFIALAKNVLSMEDIRTLEELQWNHYTIPAAYDSFCENFESLLIAVSLRRGIPEPADAAETGAQAVLSAVICACVQKIYLDNYLRALRKKKNGQE